MPRPFVVWSPANQESKDAMSLARFKLTGLVLLQLVFCSSVGILQAQLPATRLQTVFPAGARAGETTNVTVTSGVDLEDLNAIHFSHPGIKGQVIPLPSTAKPAEEPRTFNITIDKDVPSGIHEVRVGGTYGFSNAIPFHIAKSEELFESEANNMREEADEIKLNAIVNARSDGGGDTDWFKIDLPTNKVFTGELLAGSLGSPLDARIEVYAANGQRIAYGRADHQGDVAARIRTESAGMYLIRISDFLYRGSAEYVYRFRVHDEPHVSFTHPSVASVNKPTQMTLHGWNLPGEQTYEAQGELWETASIEITPDRLQQHSRDMLEQGVAVLSDRVAYTHQFGDGRTVQFPLATTSHSILLEEQGDDPLAETPQPVTIPAAICGTFDRWGDADRYTFPAKKDEQFVIEVISQTGDVPTDPFLTLERITVDGNGKESIKGVAIPDEADTALPPGNIDDPRFLLKADADATYRVTVRDRFGSTRSGPNLTYRLSIRPVGQNFSLFAKPQYPVVGNVTAETPSSVNLRKGDTIGIEVFVEREPGMAAPISISVEGLPEQISAAPLWLPAAEKTGKLILTSREETPVGTWPIKIVGTAQTSAGEMREQARLMTYVRPGANNAPGVYRASYGLLLSVQPKPAPLQVTANINEITVGQNSSVVLPLEIKRREGFDDKITLQPMAVPKGWNLDVKPVTINKGENQAWLQLTTKNNSPPQSVSLHFKPQAQVDFQRNLGRVARANELQKQAQAALDSANEKVKAADAKLAQEKKSLQELEKSNAAQQAERDKLAKQIEELGKERERLAKLQQQLDTDAGKLEKLEASRKTLEAELQAATKAAEADPDNEKLKQAVEEKQAAVKQATEDVTATQKSVEATRKTIQGAKLPLAKVMEELETLTKKQKEAEAAIATSKEQLKTLKDGLPKLEQELNQFKADVKNREKEKATADKEVKDAANASKAQKLNVSPPSVPVTLHIKPTNVAPQANVPNGGSLKAGEELDIRVTIKRENDYKGPVTLVLAGPTSELETLTWEAVTIAADKTEANLKVKAKAEAAPTEFKYLSVRAKEDADADYGADAKLNLKIVK